MTRNFLTMLSLSLVLGLLTGCGQSPPAKFVLNFQGKKSEDFRGKPAVQQISNALFALFGTPDEPYVFPESGLDLHKIRIAAGPTGGNQDGSQRGLYRQHCAHCHGISGDGAGPTAGFLNPYPRDYRLGLYKFKATERAARPTSKDLERIIRHGIPGTAMPSFELLPGDEVEALVEYVRYLSIRGEVETLLWADAADNDYKLDVTRDYLVGLLNVSADMWKAADGAQVAPGEYPSEELKTDSTKWTAFQWNTLYPDAYKAAVDKKPDAWHMLGEAIFKGGKAQCMKCHGPTGLGDGSEEALFDDWNKTKPAARQELLLNNYTLAKQEVRPRSFRTNIFRFGRSPADIYRRVHAGINGTPMPEGKLTLKPEEIWALVDYVRAMPFQHPNQQPHQTATMVRDRQ